MPHCRSSYILAGFIHLSNVICIKEKKLNRFNVYSMSKIFICTRVLIDNPLTEKKSKDTSCFML